MMNRIKLSVFLWLSLTIAVPSVSLAGSNPAYPQNMDEACGNAADSVVSEPKGRWLPWSEDYFDQEQMSPGFIRKEHDILTDLAQPFMHLPILSPPPGVEVRPSRSMGYHAYLKEPMPGAELMIQIFHPTYKQAGEASADVKAYINNLSVVFPLNGAGGFKDEQGSIYLEPIQVGKLAGAPVYWLEKPRSCMVVFKAHDRPLWKPVSRERYLLLRIHEMEKGMSDARKDYEEGKKEQTAGQGGMSEEQQKALIEQIRQTDPKAARDMEKQFAQMRKMIAEQMPGLRKQADADFAKTTNPVLQKFKNELAAMTPAERASAAYISGLHHSEISGLGAADAMGSRALVAPADDYFSSPSDLAKAQLLAIQFSSVANHSPETVIITRLRKDMNWQQFWRFVGR